MTFSPVLPTVLAAVHARISNAKALSSISSIEASNKALEGARGTSNENAALCAYGKVACFSAVKEERSQAVEALLTALSSGYQLSETAFWLAVAQMEDGRYADARQTLAGLVRTDPTNEEAAALLEIFKARVKAEGSSALRYAAIGVAAAVGLYVLYRWWAGPSSSRQDIPSSGYYQQRLERHRWPVDSVDARPASSGPYRTSSGPPTGSSGSSASAPSAFGSRGSGSYRL